MVQLLSWRWRNPNNRPGKNDLKAPRLKSRECQIILVLAILLVVGVIVALVLLIQNALSGARAHEAAKNQFLAELKPLLSNESLFALDIRVSPQSKSLQWMFESSDFQSWSFHRKVQRYAMATIYYATSGPTWYHSGNWLTNATECTWFQGSEGDFCDENGTLLILNQTNNALVGKMPGEIRLLSSLTFINLSMNGIFGSLLSKISSFTALTHLSVGDNSFSGTVPTELGSLTELAYLDLSRNDFQGTIPAELGSLTGLTELSLGRNFFDGTVPSELGSLTALTYLSLNDNFLLSGTVPSDLCMHANVSIGDATGLQCSCCNTTTVSSR